MKKIFLILSIALLSISCNDDDDDDAAPAKEINDALVTRISRDGITAIELYYDIEKRLNRVDYYFLGNYASYYLFEYNDDGLKETRRYDADDHSLDYRSVYTLDNFGRVIKAENYIKPDFFDEPSTLFKFEYNGSGQLIARQYSNDLSSFLYREEYAYDVDGNLIKEERTYSPNQEDEYIAYQYEFTPRSQLLPESWEEYAFILGITGIDHLITNMFLSSIHYKGWTSNGELNGEFHTEMSGQEFDENGNLTGQVVTQKNILNPQNPDDVTDMTYDYPEEN